MRNFRAKNLNIREGGNQKLLEHAPRMPCPAPFWNGISEQLPRRWKDWRPELEVCREVGGEEEKRRICCGHKLQVRTPPCLFELDLIK